MTSAQTLALLCILPAVALAYTCYSDIGAGGDTRTCTGTINCYTQNEYDIAGKFIKTLKGCDNLTCQNNNCYNTSRTALGYSNICCCTGDHCNSATSKSLIALPLVFVSYFLLK